MPSSSVSYSDIAIIGMSSRLPGSKNTAEFWQNLRAGVECITKHSEDQLRAAFLKSLGYVPETILSRWLQDPHYVSASAGLEDIDLFDAEFFGYTSTEAELMDPQQRIFLECAWEVLENAGYDPETYAGLIGVYAGSEMSYYHHRLQDSILPTERDLQEVLGNENAYLTTRVSYKLNLRGPSFGIQSACSTSLTAIHIACQSLKSGECDMALAGGVTAYPTQNAGYLYQEGGIVSPDGYCRPFDARANGTVFADGGVGVLVLKRLVDAIKDGDPICAVIKGSAVNNDGSLKTGYTAPGVGGQVRVVLEALAVADVAAESISYVETHGTGTPLGDPIEIAALTQAFQRKTQKKKFCAIGSVKSNLGHLGVAAGVTGVIKTVLALQNKMLPPSLHYEQPNPQIDFENSPFYVNKESSVWLDTSTPRRAGVSSLGIGGSNAHIILEEAPPLNPKEKRKARSPQLLILSARSASGLETVTSNLVEHLKLHGEQDFADVVYTLARGRHAFAYRCMVVCHDREDAIQTLGRRDPARLLSTQQEAIKRPIIFMFPGGGAQYVNMGCELYRNEPVFREHIDICAELLRPQLGLDLRELLYPDDHRLEACAREFVRPSLGLPALFMVSYALAKLWLAWGIHPTAMIGHSLGEYVAACLAKVLTLEDALALVVLRGHLFERLPAGGMLSVALPEEQIIPLLGSQLSIAAINSPTLCVVSGPVDAINELQAQVSVQGVETRNILISVAAHSQMVTSILDDFAQFIKKLSMQAPTIPYVSNVTGTWITAEETKDPAYWINHLRQTVRFDTGVQLLLQEPDALFLEVGPGQTLSSLVRLHPAKAVEQRVLSSTPHAKEQRSDVTHVLTTLGQFWLAGIQPSWAGFYAKERRLRVPLPVYPFERQSYWIYPSHNRYDTGQHAQSQSPVKKTDATNWFYIPSWKRSLAPVSLQGDLKQSRRWLVFSDTGEIGTNLTGRLEKEGQRVINILAGERFGKLGEYIYTLNPHEPGDYEALFDELMRRDLYPQRIVHLWNVTPVLHSNGSPVQVDVPLEQSLDSGFYSLLFLAQALGKQENVAPLPLWVVTNNMQEVVGEEILYPEKAILLGPCKVIPLEYQYLSCCSVDIVVPAENWQQQRLIEQLYDEFSQEPLDTVVAYRGRHRYLQTVEATALQAPTSSVRKLRERGVYLITGGLGGIGLVLADYLARDVHARLVLLGKSAFPERDVWSQWLSTHAEHDVVSVKIRAVLAMEKLGADVLIVSADVSSQEQMREVMAQIQRRFGSIHGVVHAAGITGGRIIQMKTRASAEQILAPKVKGTLVLADLLKHVQLDFFVLCSSVMSLTGGFGQVDHCGANAFLDAFAHWSASRPHLSVFSINWDAWQKVGQAANTEVPSDLKSARAQKLEQAILPAEGVDAFRRILAYQLPQTIMSTVDFNTRVEPVTQSNLLEEQEALSSPKNLHPRPALTTTYVAPQEEIEITLATIWQELFGFSQIGVYDDFYDLGGHSLLATKLVLRLQKTFQLDIPLGRVLELHTIAALAVFIEEMLIKKIEELSEEEVQLLGQDTFHFMD